MLIKNTLPVIFGLAGMNLTQDEKTLLQNKSIFGIILFARNVETTEQLKALVRDIKTHSKNPQIMISIDEEGGRVTRLNKIFSPLPSSQEIGDLYQKSQEDGLKLLRTTYREIAKNLRQFDITICYAPVCDLAYPETHDVIGDRAFSSNKDIVITLAKHAADTLLAEGIFPVIKHIPGHGLARSDSHLELPIIKTELEYLAENDFAIFRELKDYPFAMSAHILYTNLDDKDPVTLSQKAISYIRNELGFKNLIMSDDLNMKALTGDMTEIANKAFQAGCDILLHCDGNMNEMLAIAELSDTRSRSFQL